MKTTIKKLKKELIGIEKEYFNNYINSFDEDFSEFIVPLIQDLQVGEIFNEMVFDNILSIMARFASPYIQTAIQNELYISAELIKRINIDELNDISRKHHVGYGIDINRNFSIELQEYLDSFKKVH